VNTWYNRLCNRFIIATFAATILATVVAVHPTPTLAATVTATGCSN